MRGLQMWGLQGTASEVSDIQKHKCPNAQMLNAHVAQTKHLSHDQFQCARTAAPGWASLTRLTGCTLARLRFALQVPITRQHLATIWTVAVARVFLAPIACCRFMLRCAWAAHLLPSLL